MQRLAATLVGATLLLACSATLQPRQVKLALTGRPGEMAVGFLTISPCSSAPRVHYGSAPDQLSSSSNGTSNTYNDGASYDHFVVLTGLQAGANYSFQADCDGSLSDVYSFVTEAQNQTRVRVAMFGDMGISGSEQNIALMTKMIGDYDFIFHVGDISYADDRAIVPLGGNPKYEDVFNQYLDSMQPLTARKPYMVCPGNHDASCHSTGNLGCPHSQLNFTAYRHRFRMPSEESGGVDNMWYSFDNGPVHFVSISTETDFPDAPEGHTRLLGPRAGPFGDQISWLKADLARANANRAQRPWIVVLGHRPMYSAGSSEFPLKARETLRSTMEGIFNDNGVDLFVAGHVHAYERQYPVLGGVVEKTYDNPRGTTHIVVGSGGNTEGITTSWSGWPEFAAARVDDDWGFGILDVQSASSLTWTFYKASTGEVGDQVTLTRKH